MGFGPVLAGPLDKIVRGQWSVVSSMGGTHIPQVSLHRSAITDSGTAGTVSIAKTTDNGPLATDPSRLLSFFSIKLAHCTDDSLVDPGDDRAGGAVEGGVESLALCSVVNFPST